VGKEGFSSLEIEMDCRFENFAFDTQVAWFKVSAFAKTAQHIGQTDTNQIGVVSLECPFPLTVSEDS